MKIHELKLPVYTYFSVNNTAELKNSELYKGLTEHMGKLPLNRRDSWESLYRKFVGVLPDEIDEEGKYCINGIHIFKYFRPWQVFNLNSSTATQSDIRAAYHTLAQKYHPDSSEGDTEVFNRINQMYRSLTVNV